MNPADETCEISDGYHTFAELYDHRRALTAALCTTLGRDAWRSKAHHPEGSPMFEGYFIVGINLPTGTITYHYKLEHWDDFAGVVELEHAPKWDGASPAGTVDRLLEWTRSWTPSEPKPLPPTALGEYAAGALPLSLTCFAVPGAFDKEAAGAALAAAAETDPWRRQRLKDYEGLCQYAAFALRQAFKLEAQLTGELATEPAADPSPPADTAATIVVNAAQLGDAPALANLWVESKILATIGAGTDDSLVMGNGHGGVVFRIHPNGQVTLGEGVDLDRAAGAFWAAVNAMGPASALKALPAQFDTRAGEYERDAQREWEFLQKHPGDGEARLRMEGSQSARDAYQTAAREIRQALGIPGPVTT